MFLYLIYFNLALILQYKYRKLNHHVFLLLLLFLAGFCPIWLIAHQSKPPAIKITRTMYMYFIETGKLFIGKKKS